MVTEVYEYIKQIAVKTKEKKMTKSILDVLKVHYNGDREIDTLDLVAIKEVKEYFERDRARKDRAMKDTDKELIDLLDMKFLDSLLFRFMAEALIEHYDRHAERPEYPEYAVCKVIELLISAACFIETFDYEQHAEDMKNDYQDKE